MERALPRPLARGVSPRAIAFALFAIVVIGLSLGASYADFMSYLEAVRRVSETGTPYAPFQLAGHYPLDTAAGGRGFVYPPTSLWLFIPFAWDKVGGLYFNVVGALAVAVVVVAIIERTGRLGWSLVPILALLALPVYSSLAVGQVTSWVAAGLGLMWLAPRQSGWFAVLGGLVKVFPAAGLVWTARHRGKVFGPLAAAGAIAVLTAVVWPSTWPDFLVAWSNGTPSCMPWSLPSFACTLGVRELGYVVAAMLLLAVLVIENDEVAFAVLGVALIVPAPDLYPNYLLIPIVAAVPLLTHYLRRTLQ